MTERRTFDREKEIPHLMSNYDHKVDKDTEKKLKADPEIWAAYPGETFYGRCWFENGKFHCSVLRYGSFRGVYSAKTPEKLMKLIITDYGPL